MSSTSQARDFGTHYSARYTTMPAGLDEAAGIYTFIFSAIQLTKFLITYAADVENAHDDLQKLLQNLEYMLEVIQELDEILRKNVKTKAIRESDLLAAEICRTNAVSVVKQLQALKKRAGAASGNEKEEMTLLRRMVWPMFKPRLKEMSQEVNDTRNLFYNVRKVYNSAPR